MAATSVDKLRVATLLGATPDNTQLQFYADAAISVIDQRLPQLADALRNMLAEHLTAHYMELEGTVGGLTAKRVGDASWSWSADALKDLRATRNGRIAADLDPTGTLSRLTQPKPAFAVL